MKTIFVFLIIFIFSLQNGSAQTFREKLEKQKELLSNKDYQGALEIAKEIEETASKQWAEDPSNLSSFYYTLGTLNVKLQKYDDAIAYYQKTADIRKKSLGKDHAQYTKVLDRMASIYRATNRPKKAEALYIDLVKVNDNDPKGMIKLAYLYLQKNDIKKAKPLLQKSLDLLESKKESLLYADALRLAGNIEYNEGKYKEAVAKLEASKKIYEAKDKNSASYFMVVDNLLTINSALGKYEETIPMYKKLLTHQATKFGKDHKTYLNTLQGLGNAYMNNEEHDKASTTIGELASTLEQKNATNTATYAYALNDKGRLAYFKGKPQSAVLLFEKSLKILKQLGIKDQEYTNTLLNLGNAHNNSKNDLAAIKCYNEVAHILKYNKGKKHPQYAKTLFMIAMLESSQKHHSKAVKLLEKAIKIQKEILGASHSSYLRTLDNLANQLLILGEHDKALPYYEEYVTAAKTKYGQSSLKYAHALKDLGGLYYEIGNYPKSEKYLGESVFIYQDYKSKDPIAYLNAIENLAVLYKNMGYYSESQTLLESALAFADQKYGQSSNHYIQVADELAVLYKTTGDYQKAEKIHLQNLLIKGKNPGENSLEYALSLNHLGILYKTTGKYSEAETNLNKALKIRKNLLGSRSYYYAETLQNLGTLYTAMGRYSEAEINLRNALKVIGNTNGKNHPDYALTLNFIVALYQKTNNTKEVEKLYTEVLEIRKNTLGEDSPEYASTLQNLASYYLNRKEFSKAKLYYEKAKKVLAAKYGTRHPAYASIINNIAILHENQGDHTQAEVYYKEAIDIIGNALGPNHPKFAKVLNNLAILYDEKKKYVQAEELYVKALIIALDQIDKTFKTLSEDEKQFFLNTNKPFFDNFMVFAAMQGKRQQKTGQPATILQKAYNLQLITKGIVLNATNRVRKNILNSNNETLIKDYKKWQAVRQAISDAYNLGVAVCKKRNINIASLENEANKLEKAISLKSLEFGKTFVETTTNWRRVQSKLKPGDVAIEITRLKTKEKILYVFFIVKPNAANPEVVILDNGIDMEKKYINFYKNTIRFKRPDVITYNEFWKPVMSHLKGVKNIYLSSDGIYNQMNVLSLFDPSDKTYLIEKLNIVNLTNTKDILDIKPSSKPKDAILFGNPSYQIDPSLKQDVKEVDFDNQNQSWLSVTRFRPLVGTKVEVEKIAKITQGKGIETTVFQEATASEKNLKKVNSPSILHIATHGFFMPQHEDNNTNQLNLDADKLNIEKNNPMLNSGIVLAGVTDYFTYSLNQKNGKEDGILTAYEATNLNLENTDLVVLSACETGLGKVQCGEGVYGLQRAFKIAGASTVIMTLWKVDDKASQKLLVSFYQKWQSGLSKRKAFQAAQKELKKEYKDPYFWGAFVMLGD